MKTPLVYDTDPHHEVVLKQLLHFTQLKWADVSWCPANRHIESVLEQICDLNIFNRTRWKLVTLWSQVDPRNWTGFTSGSWFRWFWCHHLTVTSEIFTVTLQTELFVSHHLGVLRLKAGVMSGSDWGPFHTESGMRCTVMVSCCAERARWPGNTHAIWRTFTRPVEMQNDWSAHVWVVQEERSTKLSIDLGCLPSPTSVKGPSETKGTCTLGPHQLANDKITTP